MLHVTTVQESEEHATVHDGSCQGRNIDIPAQRRDRNYCCCVDVLELVRFLHPHSITNTTAKTISEEEEDREQQVHGCH